MEKIRLESISKKFGDVQALKDINLSVEKGKYVVVLGPSGAGKTTLLKVIAGLYKADSGNIYVDKNINITDFPPEDRNIAFLPQDYALFPKKNVWENISFSPSLQKITNTNDLVKEILLMIHLTDRLDAYPHELSGGMKQRTALGRSLATNYQIMLLDEPLRALDARLRLELRSEIKKMVTDLDFTVFHVTHDQEEAFSVGDIIVVLNEGRIEQIGDQEELYQQPKNEFVASFLGEVNKVPGKIHNKDKDLSNKGYQYNVSIGDDKFLKVLSGINYEINSEVTLIIKSESIKVVPLSFKEFKKNGNGNGKELKINNEKSNWINGKVKEKYYLGKYTNFEIEAPALPTDRENLLAKLSSRKAVKFNPEEDVLLQIKPELILIVPTRKK